MTSPHIMSRRERREHLIHEHRALASIRRLRRGGMDLEDWAVLRSARALDAAVVDQFRREDVGRYRLMQFYFQRAMRRPTNPLTSTT